MSTDDIPTIGQYRGVGLFDHQSPVRLAVVKAEIDAVMATDDPGTLVAFASCPDNAPESRILAGAKCEAIYLSAADDRKARPNIDVELVRASVAGLKSKTWRDPDYHGSLIDSSGSRSQRREHPLTGYD